MGDRRDDEGLYEVWVVAERRGELVIVHSSDKNRAVVPARKKFGGGLPNASNGRDDGVFAWSHIIVNEKADMLVLRDSLPGPAL